ncbi:hypothetical protein BD410DRAFT_841788 [Rickenella mellea]|uniref:F-box domain-containing protein n=1 Tax=Rickenella mellea TaxID=50990 RepID=A0A4Y7PWN7_9AGAM|nr:hypothetical protein BD410DRAFT_841788 [Rickenella mellea]
MYKGIDPCLLFDQIFLPSLATLKVTMYGFSTSEWQHLLPLLKRSRPPLLSLELDGVPMTEQTLIECLSYMPKLTELTFGGIDCSDSTLVALTVDNDEGVPSANLCPLLQVIGIGTSSFSAIALKNMILSRWVDPAAPTTSLPRKSLEIVRCPAFEIYSALSDPAIVNCLRNGLKMVEWEADVDQEDDEDDDSDSDTDVDDTDDGGYDTEEEDWEEEGGDDPDLLQ